MKETWFHASLLAFDNLQAIFDIRWSVDLPPQSMPSSSHGVLVCSSSCVCVCLSVQIFPFYKDGSHPLQLYDYILHILLYKLYIIFPFYNDGPPNDLLTTSAKTLSPNKITFIGSEA